MIIKNLIDEFIHLEEEKQIPNWMNNKSVSSKIYESDYFYRIRLSCIEIENKFVSESLVIYPHKQCDAPIFGTEYMIIGNKTYFGAIDFHPLKNKNDIESYLKEFPNKKITSSKYYDLNKFFSNHLWVKKQKSNLINEYQILLKCYLHQYLKCVKNSNICHKNDIELLHKKYNQHMGENDPVAGILKSYFGEEFSKKYIKEFLFPY